MIRAFSRAALCASLLALPMAAHAAEIGKAPEQLGKVSFANSCAPEAQPSLERGVALLHSFWFKEGIAAFQQTLAADPGCAIAYWGIASLLIGNPFGVGPTPEQAQQAQQAIALGRKVGAGSERERLYIEAIAAYYDHFAERSHASRRKSQSNAFEDLATRFPADDETQMFSGLYLTATQDPGDKSFAATLRAASILEPLFARYPDHPGVAHYLIHSYDYPPVADKGLAAALCYADIAPSAPHALHMPSHIFTRVGAWQESVATNRRSVEALKNTEGADPVEALHAWDYMVYADLQLARDQDAVAIVGEAAATKVSDAAQAGRYARAAIPARYAMERGMWKEAAALQPEKGRFPWTEAMTEFARALGAARSGDPAAADADVQALAGLVAALQTAKDYYWATEVEVQRLGAAAWTDYARGNKEQALAGMRAAADLEDSSEKSAVTPGRLIPARELLGDMLLESGRPADAIKEYETSQSRDPKRFRSLYGAGAAAEAAGNADKAQYYYKRVREMVGAADARPELDKARAYLAAR